ncbi:unnamed protein product, partial [Vitis vinifera]
MVRFCSIYVLKELLTLTITILIDKKKDYVEIEQNSITAKNLSIIIQVILRFPFHIWSIKFYFSLFGLEFMTSF